MVTLIVGVMLQAWVPLKLSDQSWLNDVAGWLLLLLGVLLAGWAVVAVNGTDIARPEKLIVSGPYTWSRNPMYVAWTMIYLAVASLLDSWWLLILLPALLAFTHQFVIRREEQWLERHFGPDYRQYRDRVRRYM